MREQQRSPLAPVPPARQHALALALLASLVASGVRAQEGGLSMEEAVRTAMERNLEVRLAAAELDAARARAGSVPLLQGNPEVSAEAGPRRRAGETSLDYSLGILQAVEVGGQRGARVDAAEAAQATAEARLRARRAEVAADVREAYGRALGARGFTRLAQQAAELAQRSLETAQARLEQGDASRLELNTARVEAARARREARLAQVQEAAATGQLRRLLGLAPSTPMQLVGELTAPPANEEAPRPEVLLARASERRADVQATAHALAAAEAEARLSAREAIPSPRLGVAFGREEEAHLVLGTLGVELPLFNRNQAARAEARGRVSQARVTREAQEAVLVQEVQLAAQRYSAALAGARDFAGETLAAVEENLALADEAYRAGKVDFLQLLLVRREAVESRRAQIEALEELNAARARLLQAIGAEGGAL